MTPHPESQMLDEKSETIAEELKRLVGEYQDDDAGESTKAEAWNMIADFAVENGPTIVSALSAISSQEAAVPFVPCDGCDGHERTRHPKAGDNGALALRECVREMLEADLSAGTATPKPEGEK